MNQNQEASTATPVVDTNENQKSGGVLVFNFGKFENQKPKHYHELLNF